MKFAKPMVWGCAAVAMGVVTYTWHQKSGWYDWAAFPSGPFLMQVALPGMLMGLICGAAIWMTSKKK